MQDFIILQQNNLASYSKVHVIVLTQVQKHEEQFTLYILKPVVRWF